LPEASKGDTRDKVAEAVGMGGRTYEKAKEVVEAAAAEPEKFGDLAQEMDRTGKVDPAHKKLKERGGARTDRGRKRKVAGVVEAKARELDWLSALQAMTCFNEIKPDSFNPRAKVPDDVRGQALMNLNELHLKLRQSCDAVGGWIAALEEELSAQNRGGDRGGGAASGPPEAQDPPTGQNGNVGGPS
jgi:hypothetical protein